MQNKFKLMLNENIFLAKKQLVKNIYNSARVEGLNITFPQTQTILDGVNVPNLPLGEIECILNLRNAWKFALSNVSKPFDLDLVCGINHYVSMNESLEWGKLRRGSVGVSGTDYKPLVPQQEKVIKDLSSILSTQDSETAKAINIFVYVVYNQLFWDGNKRTATIAANQYMISKGVGVLSIAESNLEEFNVELHVLYKKGNADGLKRFLYEKCVTGMEVDSNAIRHNDDCLERD